MNKLIVVATLVLVASAAIKHSDTKSVLTEIDQDTFGHSILSAVQAHMQTSNPADEVNMLMNELLAAINDGQKDHDGLRRVQTAACGRISADLDNDAQYHDAQRSSNTLLRDDTVEALAASEADLRQTTVDIQENEAVTLREQANRDGQHSVWAHKDEQHAESLEAVDDGIKLINHLQLGASFAQLKSKYDVVLKKLSSSQVHEALFKPIVAALVELSTSVDFKAIQKISVLLGELRQQLVESRLALQDAEDRQVARWAEFSAHLNNEHTRLVERKAALEQQIGTQKETIAEAEEFIEYHDFEFESSTEALANETTQCTQQEYIYETQSSDRQIQLDQLTRIQEHINEHVAATAQFLAGRETQ